MLDICDDITGRAFCALLGSAMRALRSPRGFAAPAAGFSACVRMPSATR